MIGLLAAKNYPQISQIRRDRCRRRLRTTAIAFILELCNLCVVCVIYGLFLTAGGSLSGFI